MMFRKREFRFFIAYFDFIFYKRRKGPLFEKFLISDWAFF